MIEDDVTQMLASRAEQAPVPADGRAMLERVRRRERRQVRGRAVAAAAAVAVLGGGGAWWSTFATPADRAVAAPRPQVSPSLRTVAWGTLRLDIPSTWTFNDTRETHSYPAGAFVDGPFLGTLPTGKMCHPIHSNGRGCSRDSGILDKHPTDGVVAWIEAAPAFKAVGGQEDYEPLSNPGPSGADAVCPSGGTTFHAFRLVRGRDGLRDRVVLDGCAYGPRTQQYLRELRAVADSLRAVEN